MSFSHLAHGGPALWPLSFSHSHMFVTRIQPTSENEVFHVFIIQIGPNIGMRSLDPLSHLFRCLTPSRV